MFTAYNCFKHTQRHYTIKKTLKCQVSNIEPVKKNPNVKRAVLKVLCVRNKDAGRIVKEEEEVGWWMGRGIFFLDALRSPYYKTGLLLSFVLYASVSGDLTSRRDV